MLKEFKDMWYNKYRGWDFLYLQPPKNVRFETFCVFNPHRNRGLSSKKIGILSHFLAYFKEK
jgi:hypothetical protein